MLRLDKHIELLLMKYDCVVLPSFGGFVKHHVSARMDESEGMMLPPHETIGFNPQLTMNDSLLVQSFVEEYDYSYPEAQGAVGEEIETLRSTLNEEGRYEVGSVGELSIDANGTLTFEPLPSGIPVPQLYGFSPLDIKRSDNFVKNEESDETPPNIIDINEEQPREKDVVIRISRRTLRRAVAACVAVMLIASIPFIGKNVDTKELTGGINLNFLYSLMPKTGMGADVASSVAASTPEIEAVPAAEESATESVASKTEAVYTVVLASKISENNATRFVNELRSDNNITAEIMPQGNAFRVIFGGYATKEEALEERQNLSTIPSLADAWIARIEDL